jgi:hypothetical protein
MPNLNLEDHPVSFVLGCLFNIFAANLHIWRPFLHSQPEDVTWCSVRDPTKHGDIPDTIPNFFPVSVIHPNLQLVVTFRYRFFKGGKCLSPTVNRLENRPCLVLRDFLFNTTSSFPYSLMTVSILCFVARYAVMRQEITVLSSRLVITELASIFM